MGMEEQTQYPVWMIREAERREPRTTRRLDLLMLGGAVALGALAAVLAIVYKAWYAQELAENTAILMSGFLFFIYTGGVYIFCYGWERGDVGRAVRLTAVVVLLSAVAVLATALVLSILSKSKGGASSDNDAGGGARDLDMGMPLRVLGSYVDDGSVRFEDERKKQDESDLFTVTCGNCQERFIPIPPRALCPKCGWAAVTVA